MARRAGKIVKGFAWIMSVEATKAVLQVALIAILSRLLTPYDYGLLGILLIATGMVEVFANMGMRQALVQRAELTEEHISTSFYLNLAFGLSLWLLFVLFRHPIAAFFHTPEVAPLLVAMGLVFPIRAASLTSQALLARGLKFKVLSGSELAGFVIGQFGVAVVLASLGAGVWALIAGILAQAALMLVIQFVVARHTVKPVFRMTAVRELLSYGGWISLAQVANFFGNKGDNIVVGRYLETSILGLYTRAFNMAMLPVGFMGTSIDTVLFPAMAAAQGEPEELRTIFKRTVSALAMLLLPTTAAGAIMAGEIIDIILGDKWAAAATPFSILLAITYFRTSYKIDAVVSKALGFARLHAIQNIVYAAMIVSFSFIGVRGGLTGVAVGVTAAVAIQFVWRRASSLKLLGLKWGEIGREYAGAAFLTVPIALTATAVKWAGAALAWPSLITFVAAAAGCAVVLAGALALMHRLGLAADLEWFYGRVRARLGARKP